ncbi:hypothetical protein Patl1_35407 [Pistacia atlantica]|nr:hypothetical protein Patl1_35407 [Pistacia atlantica]
MKSAIKTIWRLLQLEKPADMKNVSQVILTIEICMDGISCTSNDGIHLTGTYIADYHGDVKREFSRVLVHEMAHVAVEQEWTSSLRINRRDCKLYG